MGLANVNCRACGTEKEVVLNVADGVETLECPCCKVEPQFDWLDNAMDNFYGLGKGQNNNNKKELKN